MSTLPSFPMMQAMQVFAARAAARAGTETVNAPEVQKQDQSSYRNFLIVAPGSTGVAAVPEEKVMELAQHLNKEGYAYVARSNQKEMEDDPSGVRYLPLRNDLPAFGVMTAVIVIGDPLWAALAAAMYPEADIYLM